MAIKNKKRGPASPKTSSRGGFALLVAVIFMSVMLALGIALSSLGYKQQLLASTAIESQYAFYVADAALECAEYADQQQNNFDYSSHSQLIPPSLIICDNLSAASLGTYTYDANKLVVSERLSLDSGKHCADITVYKYNVLSPPSTVIFSQGYDISCTTLNNLPVGTRFVSRGLSTSY